MPAWTLSATPTSGTVGSTTIAVSGTGSGYGASAAANFFVGLVSTLTGLLFSSTSNGTASSGGVMTLGSVSVSVDLPGTYYPFIYDYTNGVIYYNTSLPIVFSGLGSYGGSSSNGSLYVCLGSDVPGYGAYAQSAGNGQFANWINSGIVAAMYVNPIADYVSVFNSVAGMTSVATGFSGAVTHTLYAYQSTFTSLVATPSLAGIQGTAVATLQGTTMTPTYAAGGPTAPVNVAKFPVWRALSGTLSDDYGFYVAVTDGAGRTATAPWRVQLLQGANTAASNGNVMAVTAAIAGVPITVIARDQGHATDSALVTAKIVASDHGVATDSALLTKKPVVWRPTRPASGTFWQGVDLGTQEK